MRGVASGNERAAAIEVAPDFDLPALVGGVKQRFHLREALAQKNIVLAFYPHNWDEASAKQMIEYQAQRGSFLARHVEVVGVSVDSIMNATVWERSIGPLDFPLCSDFWPHGKVSRDYGVLREQEPSRGSCERALFVISRAGKVEFSRVYGLHEPAPISDTFAVLQRL